MRVAHFVQRYPPALGGSEAYFARLSQYLAAAGEQVKVFTTTALDLEAFWSPRGRCLSPGENLEVGVEVKRYPLWRFLGRRYLLKPLSLVPHRLWQCLTLPCNPIAFGMWAEAGQGKDRFDIVHASAFPYAWPITCGLRLARRLGVPFLLTPFLHLGDPDRTGDRMRRSYLSPALLSLVQAADRIFVQTHLERNALLQEGIPSEKLVLQGLGVEPAECCGGNRERIRREWQVGPGDIVIGHLANNSEEKGTVDLIRATDLVRKRGLPFLVVLAGPEMPNFRRFWEGHNVSGRILRLGPMSEPHKRDFFAGLDLFALPSRSDSFGLVLLEAWANGLANVAYRAGGVAEVIHHEEDGMLVRCGDINELAKTLEKLIGDNNWRKKLGQAGQARTRQEFRWQDKLGLVRRIYQELTNGSP